MTGALRIVALHGFLGRPSDWDGLGSSLPEARVSALDIWEILRDPGVDGWASLSRALDGALARALGGDDGPAFVVAYSFGARLALSSSTLPGGAPVLGVCLASCNPGLPTGDDAGRAARRASDEEWARRLLEWPEDDIWAEWDAQPVLRGGAAPPARGGLPAAREVLSRAMRTFSLSAQPDFRARLRGWQAPLLWVTGARDAKFCAIARDLSASGVPARFVTCEDAGHRVPWDNPPAFARAVRGWIAGVMENSR